MATIESIECTGKGLRPVTGGSEVVVRYTVRAGNNVYDVHCAIIGIEECNPILCIRTVKPMYRHVAILPGKELGELLGWAIDGSLQD